MAEQRTTTAGTRHAHLVVHGKLAGHAGLREAVQVARALGHRVTVQVTWEAGDAERFAQQAALDEVDAVVAVGGDGTLNAVVNGVAAAGLPSSCGVGLIPLGTANDFAAGTGLPLGDPLAALRLVVEGTAHLIDVGQVNDRYFLNVVSGGPATQVTRDTPEGIKALFGSAAYYLTGMALLPALVPLAATLRAPGWEWSGKLVVFAVGNGKQAGGGIPLCSQASLTDGLLDVLVIPDSDENDLIGVFTQMLRLHLPKTGPQMLYHQVPTLELESPQPMPLNVDGEKLEAARYHWQVHQRQLWFFLP